MTKILSFLIMILPSYAIGGELLYNFPSSSASSVDIQYYQYFIMPNKKGKTAKPPRMFVSEKDIQFIDAALATINELRFTRHSDLLKGVDVDALTSNESIKLFNADFVEVSFYRRSTLTYRIFILPNAVIADGVYYKEQLPDTSALLHLVIKLEDFSYKGILRPLK